MALHWPTFFTRLGSAIVFSAIMMAGLLWNELAFALLIILIMVLCLRDYFRLGRKIVPATGWPGWLYALGGLVYIVMPVLMLAYLRGLSIIIPLALVLMIWTNDTMAYLVGSFIGKTPFSSISPKKTWEGTAGGALLTIAGAAIWGYYAHWYHMTDWIALAICASVAGTAGDLFESKLKRLANVKDSGTMMPGHGGALDRFDSLLVTTPFAFVYAYFFMPPVFLVIF